MFSPQWDQHTDVTTTQSLSARPTTAVCHCGLFATATTTAETTVMNRAVVSLRQSSLTELRSCLHHGSDLKTKCAIKLYVNKVNMVSKMIPEKITKFTAWNKIVCSRSEWGAISQHLSLLWNITQWGSGRWWWRGSHHSPSPALCLSLRAPQIYELSGGMDLHLCVCVVALSLRGGRVHTSLFVLSLRSKHTRRGPPVSYRRPSLH